MSLLLQRAAEIQDLSFEGLKMDIANDEFRDRHRIDNEFAAEEASEYDRVVTLDPNDFLIWLEELQAGAALDKDYETIAYIQLAVDKMKEFLDA
jgi:hypothetical protein